jgi:palmitoyltransferase ZDHHC2/15/20
MGWREFGDDVIRVVMFTLYPIIELYAYFVFVGLYCLEDDEFDDWPTLLLFIVYHLLIIYKTIFYMKLFISEGVSTLEIFPDMPTETYDVKLRGVNVFIEEEIMKKNMSKIKLCSQCKTYKPPRAHHCSVCRRCYLKYDHHCTLLDTCIGFHNYKFFYQFLVLNLSSTLFIVITIFYNVLAHHSRGSLLTNYLIAIVLNAIALVVTLALLVFHTNIIGMNETTIEHYVLNDYIRGDHSFAHTFQEGPVTTFSGSTDRRVLNPYNLGVWENWRQVFGPGVYDWFVPSYSSLGDGITFPKNYSEYEVV